MAPLVAPHLEDAPDAASSEVSEMRLISVALRNKGRFRVRFNSRTEQIPIDFCIELKNLE